jgi:hypothetical protein
VPPSSLKGQFSWDPFYPFGSRQMRLALHTAVSHHPAS